MYKTSSIIISLDPRFCLCRFVGRFIPRKERLLLLGDKLRKFNNVYIKNFGDDLDDEKLKQLFEPFGKIISAKVIKPAIQ